MRFKTVAAAACVTLVTVTASYAANFTPSAPIVDFETISVGTTGPITVGPMTVSGANMFVRAQNFTQVPEVFEGRYFGQFVSTITLDFAVDMFEVGFGLFDPNIDGTVVQAFDRAGNLLETIAPPLGPTGGVFSIYVEFNRSQGDIARVLAIPAATDVLGIDNIAWNSTAPTKLPD